MTGLRKLSTNQSHADEPFPYEKPTQACAVCRAGRRVERNRCAVRMTARGSAAPGMACRDRPVERIPQAGAFPAAGLTPAAGLLRAAASALNPPPPSGRLANHHCRHRAERPKQHPSSQRDAPAPKRARTNIRHRGFASYARLLQQPTPTAHPNSIHPPVGATPGREPGHRLGQAA